jgi:hypothetical protein
VANRERGERDLVARHRSYTGRLTVSACCDLEDRTGRTLVAVVDGVNAGLATYLRWMVWAALQDKHRKTVVTPAHAGAVIDAAGGMRVMRGWLAEFMALNADDKVETPPATDGSGVADTRPGSLWRRLYLDARCAGMAPRTFWSLSLRELWLELAASRQRQQQLQERDLALAWWTNGLARQKRLPKLETFLGRAQRKTRRKQSWLEIKGAMNALMVAQQGKAHDGSGRQRHA